ncbi:PIN domain-containing protein [Nitrosomonas sp.]|uniref:PIN domain-containing protein n=1 Tax=Nitrosomonas sp. TaxID=42353 RepID=UPI00208CF05D|nr:PIN domain-containing protein [Nitrosomonas sp.]GJL74460.1 MAG: ribonuclease VapC [Nitrosomonas sp.]
MKEDKAFLDTNILLYLLSADETKAIQAENTIVGGGTISVQVLNEFASVSRRKLKMPFAEIQEILAQIRIMCAVEPVSVNVHDRGLQIAEHYGFSIYDAMIVATALLADCTILYSEDLQDGQVIDGQLMIRNPFISHSR